MLFDGQAQDIIAPNRVSTGEAAPLNASEDIDCTATVSYARKHHRAGRRSLRDDQPTHCTYGGQRRRCASALTAEEIADRLVHCAMHRARARSAAQRSRNKKVIHSLGYLRYPFHATFSLEWGNVEIVCRWTAVHFQYVGNHGTLCGSGERSGNKFNQCQPRH